MNFTHIKAEYIPQKEGMKGIWEKIEQAGHVCYKNEDRIKYDGQGNSLTAEKFANKLLNVYKHRSVAEHATIYLTIHADNFTMDEAKRRLFDFLSNKKAMKYSEVHKQDEEYETTYYITTNYRVIIENHYEDLMKFMVNPSLYHEPRYTIKVFTNRGVSAEMNRHRVNSPSERSTRYVDSKHGLSISIPIFIDENELKNISADYEQEEPYVPILDLAGNIVDGVDMEPVELWYYANAALNYIYQELRKKGWAPQQARSILPSDLETELMVTAFKSDWERFMDQRLKGITGTPHPDMKETAKQILLVLPDNKLKDNYLDK